MSGEVSIYCVNAVVYEALVGEEAEWKPLGNSAWSEMHVFKDDSAGVGNFRIVAWIPDTTEVILNTNILPDTIWEIKSEDFAELANTDEPRYGIYFPSPDVANATTGVINETVEKLTVPPPAAVPFKPPPPPKEDTGPQANPVLENEVSERIVPDINPGEPPQAPQETHEADGAGTPAGDGGTRTAEEADGAAQRHSLAEFDQVQMATYNASRSDSANLAEEIAKVSIDEAESGRKGDSFLGAPPSWAVEGGGGGGGGAAVNLLPGEEGYDPDAVPLPAPDEADAKVLPSQSKRLSALEVAKPLPDSKIRTTPSMDDGTSAMPSNLSHQVHVTYNEFNARYEGLPEEWAHMNQQFGVPYESIPKSSVPGYDERIPSVLVMMKRKLIENNGRDQVGIFRLAPDRDDCDFVKDQINSGTFEHVDDVNVIANLIKVWFRDMPSGLLNTIDDETIYKIADLPTEEVPSEYHQFAEPTKSLFLWLLDLMAEVVTNEAVNKMSAKNMSIVLSPNLYQINSENPMAALTMAQKIADFTTKMLAGRLREKHDYDARI